MYKLISKILANKLQSFIGRIVDPSQSEFIPNRQTLDNIILASELIKGYGRKSLLPRMMIKIDPMKAYDSVEWKLLEEIMIELGVPLKMVG